MHQSHKISLWNCIIENAFITIQMMVDKRGFKEIFYFSFTCFYDAEYGLIEIFIDWEIKKAFDVFEMDS